MKKIIAREFLWFLIIILLAAPLALLFLSALDIASEGYTFSLNEKDFIMELFILAYIINIAGLYLVRLIVMAIKVLFTEGNPKP
ncbi:MAG: hypothetical protein ACK5CH_04755 [Bacteroidota bacterium]|jgi:hypothetical protein